MTFTEKELDGVVSSSLEEWLQDNEVRIRNIARTFDSHAQWQGLPDPYYEDIEKLYDIIQLLAEAYFRGTGL